MKINWILLGIMLNFITVYSFAWNGYEDGLQTVSSVGVYVSSSLQDSTDYTQQAPAAVSIKAENSIILSDGFHFKATEGNSLITQLVPQMNSRSNRSDKLFPATDLGEYEILQLQQGVLTIRYTAGESSGHLTAVCFEIVNMNTGQMEKKGKLSAYETQVDIADLQSGFYVVKLTNGKLVQTKKIVIRN